MANTVRMALSLPKTLFTEAEILARQLKVSPSRLLGMALEAFLGAHQTAPALEAAGEAPQARPGAEPPAAPPREDLPAVKRIGGGEKVLYQGEVYWVPLETPEGIEPGPIHPHVVIQDDVINHSRVGSVVVCALTTNMKRAKAPGHVLLEAGEGGLPRQSIVVASQVTAVDKTQLGAYVGRLSQKRVQQILAGLRFVQTMTRSPAAGGEAAGPHEAPER